MGRKRQVKYFGNALKGDFLTDDDCRKLDTILQIHDGSGSIPDLTNKIVDLDEDQVESVINNGFLLGDVKEGKLKDYQTVNVAYAYFAKRAILGAGTGMGKTPIVAGVINLLREEYEDRGKPFSYLFLGERNSLRQIQRKLVRFTGEPVQVTTGERHVLERVFSEHPLETRPNLLVSHSALDKHLFYDAVNDYKNSNGKPPFDIVIIDESSNIGVATGSTGSMKNKKFKNLQWIMEGVDYRIGLNATPMGLNLLTFFHQIHLVDESLLPTKTNFMERYVVQEYDHFAGYKKPTGEYRHSEEFQELVKYRYLGSTRKGYGGTISNCKGELISVPLTPVQERLLKETSMPKMVYDCPWYFDRNIPVLPSNAEKLGVVRDKIEEMSPRGEPVFIYAHNLESQYGLQYFLEGVGIYPEILNGTQTFEQKQEIIERFSSGETRVLISNVEKSLDFEVCKNLIFYTSITDPSKMQQIEGRFTRGFNIEGLRVVMLTTKGKEEKKLLEEVAPLARANQDFTSEDFSISFNILYEAVKEKDSEGEMEEFIPEGLIIPEF